MVRLSVLVWQLWQPADFWSASSWVSVNNSWPRWSALLLRTAGRCCLDLLGDGGSHHASAHGHNDERQPQRRHESLRIEGRTRILVCLRWNQIRTEAQSSKA